MASALAADDQFRCGLPGPVALDGPRCKARIGWTGFLPLDPPQATDIPVQPACAASRAWLASNVGLRLAVVEKPMGDVADIVQRIWTDLLARPSGPEGFRFILQPVVASALAVRDGIKDARTGRSPYFWTVLHNPEKRNARLREGLAATSRVIGLGFVMDVIYQWRVLGTFYLGEAFIVVLTLAFLPYFLVRGPVDRIARWWMGDPPKQTR